MVKAQPKNEGLFSDQVEEVPIDSIQPHPRNARQGDVGAIVESIEHNGVYRPLFVDERTQHILAGTHTWRALKASGAEKVKVLRIRTRDEDHALRIMLVDNRVNDLASYDDNALLILLQELATTDVRLAGTGFDGDALDDLLAKLNPPDLADLLKKHGAFVDEDGYEVVTYKLPREVASRLKDAVARQDGANDGERVTALLDQAEAER